MAIQDGIDYIDGIEQHQTISSDLVSGKQFQRVKLDIGGDGVSSPVTALNPMPVIQDGVSTEATAQLILTELLTKLESGGSVAVSNFPLSQAVTGTVAISNLPGTQPVSGSVSVSNFPSQIGLTDTQLRASALSVTTTNPTPPGLTDTQLRATALPVSGTVAVSNPGLTDSQLRASVVPTSVSNFPAASAVLAETADYAPGYGVVDSTPGAIARDDNGSMHTRGQVLTDEGGYRANFANASLSISIGTCTFTSGSTEVLWTYSGLYDIHVGDYVYLTADGAIYAEPITGITPTTITLEEPYLGAGGTGVASRQILNGKVGTGGTITVTNGACVITAGTTTGSTFELERDVDYMPVKKFSGITVSQRIVNQDVYLGFYGESYAPTNVFAWFHFSGTDNTVVMCKTGRNPTGAPSASEQEVYTVKIPNGGTTATSHRYATTIQKNKVSFWIDEIRVAQCFKVCPRAHDFLTSTVQVVNGTTPATSTVVTVDYDACVNENSLSVDYFSDDTAAQAPNVPILDNSYNLAGVIAINTDLVLLDCMQLRQLVVSCVSIGTAGVVTPAFSNDDGTTWFTPTYFTPAGAQVTTTFNAAGNWIIPVVGRLFRLRLTTATTAGTTTLRTEGFQQAPYALTFGTQVVSGTVTANIGTGSLAAGTNLIADVGVQYRANATGAATIKHLVALGTTNLTSVKASAGRVVGWSIVNTVASWRYVKLHNIATAPTAGTGVVQTIAVPPSGVNNMPVGAGSIGFATGIAFSTTTGVLDADTVAVTANDLVIDIFYA